MTLMYKKNYQQTQFNMDKHELTKIKKWTIKNGFFTWIPNNGHYKIPRPCASMYYYTKSCVCTCCLFEETKNCIEVVHGEHLCNTNPRLWIKKYGFAKPKLHHIANHDYVNI